jgi:nicotinamidase-related amidase
MGGEAVIVVDMLRGFLEPGHPLYCGDEARSIIPEVVRLLAGRPSSPRVYLADSHRPDDREFRMFPPHCLQGSVESELIPELAPFPGTIVPKTRYSGFFGTDLDRVLGRLAPAAVTVVGVCTDICVLHTVADLRNRDYEVRVPAGCVASFDAEAHRWALRHMEKILGATVV